MAEIKEPIRIRRKKLTNGNVSLYLDIYLNGKREYEFLKLYLIPEKTKAGKSSVSCPLKPKRFCPLVLK